MSMIDRLTEIKLAKGGKPVIICVDGSDGSGKQTQTTLIVGNLIHRGYNVKKISFPQYDNESSIFVKKYLAGEYGNDASTINPYVSSSFFIMDRLISFLNEWKEVVESDDYDFVILDRYVTSNLLHQGAKFFDNEKKVLHMEQLREYIKWEEDLEYNKFGLPKPDVVFFLDMPRWAARLFTENRANKATGGTAQDIHESNEEYMEQVAKISNTICRYCKWEVVSCIDTEKPITNGAIDKIMSAEEINQKLMNRIDELFINDGGTL